MTKRDGARKGRPVKAAAAIKKQFSVRMDDEMLSVIDALVEASQGFLADRAAVIRMAVKLAAKDIKTRIESFQGGDRLDPEKTPSAEELAAERAEAKRRT